MSKDFPSNNLADLEAACRRSAVSCDAMVAELAGMELPPQQPLPPRGLPPRPEAARLVEFIINHEQDRWVAVELALCKLRALRQAEGGDFPEGPFDRLLAELRTGEIAATKCNEIASKKRRPPVGERAMSFNEVPMGRSPISQRLRSRAQNQNGAPAEQHVRAAMILKYEGFIAEVGYQDGDELMHGSVTNTRAVLHFAGKTIDEMKQAFADTIEDYRAWCAERGVKPYSRG